jgi:hypothetical protein
MSAKLAPRMDGGKGKMTEKSALATEMNTVREINRKLEKLPNFVSRVRVMQFVGQHISEAQHAVEQAEKQAAYDRYQERMRDASAAVGDAGVAAGSELGVMRASFPPNVA